MKADQTSGIKTIYGEIIRNNSMRSGAVFVVGKLGVVGSDFVQID